MEIADTSYGSDKNGLIWAYLFVPDQPAREIDAAVAADWLHGQHPDAGGNSFIWLHFSLANTSTERWLRSQASLPALFYESLHQEQEAVSTRVEQEDASLVALMHDVRIDASFDASSVSSVSVCLEPRLLVSARLRPLRSVDRLRAAVKSGQAFRASGELLGQLLRDQADVLAEVVRKSTAQVDAIEDKLLAGRVSSGRRDLGSLRRLLVRLQRLLAPEPTAFFRLLSRPPAWLGENELQELRQAAEEFASAIADSASLAERVKLLQEEFAALTNEQTSRTLFLLTMVTVLALPINMTAGLFGMNVGGIPFGDYRHGFVMIVTILVCVTGYLAYMTIGKHKD
jgi:zinc transporter